MRFLLDILYPPRCPFCDELRENRKICQNCFESINFLEGDFTAAHLERIWFNRARSCLAYEGKVADAIHALKYSRRFDLIHIFTDLLEDEAKKMGGYDIIVPVPIHWLRLMKRGYNQSAVISRALAKRLKIKCDRTGLKKILKVPPQVGLDREARLKNVRESFDVGKGKDKTFEGRKILLIDDVLTTGATVNECAKVLVKKGHCGIVDVLTVARTI